MFFVRAATASSPKKKWIGAAAKHHGNDAEYPRMSGVLYTQFSLQRAGERVILGQVDTYQHCSKQITIVKRTKKEMSEYMRELGRKGGLKTAKKGKDYMSKLGRKGYEALSRKKTSN